MTIRKNDAARMRPDPRISSLGITAKYATLANIYRMPTEITANGAEMVSVRTGLRVSLRA